VRAEQAFESIRAPTPPSPVPQVELEPTFDGLTAPPTPLDLPRSQTVLAESSAQRKLREISQRVKDRDPGTLQRKRRARRSQSTRPVSGNERPNVPRRNNVRVPWRVRSTPKGAFRHAWSAESQANPTCSESAASSLPTFTLAPPPSDQSGHNFVDLRQRHWRRSRRGQARTSERF